MTTENWLPIDNWPNYQVSNLGRVRSCYPSLRRRSADGVLAPIKSGPYLYVNLYSRNKLQKCPIHGLVCEMFHGAKPSPNHEVAHADGDATNNQSGNLRWATRSSNMQDKKAHGTNLTGESHNLAKLTWASVRDIRARYLSGEKQRTIAEAFSVKQGTISLIVLNRTWIDSTYTPNIRHKNRMKNKRAEIGYHENHGTK